MRLNFKNSCGLMLLFCNDLQDSQTIDVYLEKLIADMSLIDKKKRQVASAKRKTTCLHFIPMNCTFNRIPLIENCQINKDIKNILKTIKSLPSNLLYIENDKLSITADGYNMNLTINLKNNII